LYAIASNVLDGIEKYKSRSPECLKEKNQTIVAETALSIGNSLVCRAIGVDFKKTLEDVVNADKAFDSKVDFSNKISSIREKSVEVTKSITTIFIVDELDRCLPGYAIKVLERLHHLFYGLDNVIVVIGVDQVQLNQSVKRIFGKKTKPERYLKKFVDFSLFLDIGELDDVWFSEFEETHFKQFKTNEADYLAMKELLTSFMQCINAREQEKTIKKAIVIHKILKQRINPLINDEFICAFELLYVLFKDNFNLENSCDWLISYNRPQFPVVGVDEKYQALIGSTQGLRNALTLLKQKGIAYEILNNKNTAYFKRNTISGKLLYGLYILKFLTAELLHSAVNFDIYENVQVAAKDKLNEDEMREYIDFIKAVKIVAELM
jgi:hypothetical protein